MSRTDPPPRAPAQAAQSLSQRLALLEARVDRLESPPPGAASAGAARLWAVDGLRRDLGPAAGGVVYGGSFARPDGGELVWQIGREQSDLLGEDWSELASRLAALGHPVRLQLLQALLRGSRTVQELAALPGLGTSGQLYHHLRELESAGWIQSPQRAQYEVAPARVIALLATMSAARQ